MNCCCEAKIKIQVAFSQKADLEVVKKGFEKIREMFGEGEYELYSLFLPRKIVEYKGFSTEIVDLLDSIPEHKYYIENPESFEEFMNVIDDNRVKLARDTDKLIVLDSGVAEGVQKEIMAHSSKILMW